MQGRHLRFQELYVPPAGLVPELAAIQLMVKPGGRLRLALRDQVAYSGGMRGVGALGVLLVVVNEHGSTANEVYKLWEDRLVPAQVLKLQQVAQ